MIVSQDLQVNARRTSLIVTSETCESYFAKPDTGNELPVIKSPLTNTEPAPLLSEVEEVVMQTKLGEAPGLYGVPEYQASSSVMPDHRRCEPSTHFAQTCGKGANGQTSGKAKNVYQSQETQKECSNYRIIALVKHASKILL